jgi:hypothetical protein
MSTTAGELIKTVTGKTQARKRQSNAFQTNGMMK